MREIFVFGSNLSGIHGAGSAKAALDNHGAIWGQAEGLQGDSYGIPTKAKNVRDVLPLEEVKKYVDRFIEFAQNNQDMTFNVVAIGTGYAGWSHETIAPMFKDAPSNCNFPKEWDGMRC